MSWFFYFVGANYSNCLCSGRGGMNMDKTIICKNEYIKIFINFDCVYMKTDKKGFPAEQLYGILSSHPEIHITNFNVFKSVLNSVTKQPQMFGKLKERISVVITDDGLTATIVYNLPEEELVMKNREPLIKETYTLLNEKGRFAILCGLI